MKVRSIKSTERLIIIGTSAGGIHALKPVISSLPQHFSIPIVIILHRLKNVKSHLESVLQAFTTLPVKEAEEKERIQSGTIYIASANYHLLIEQDQSFSLSVDELVNFSRPSIDVSFVSASEVYQEKLIGIILTGANADGAKGLLSVKEHGGQAIVQDPEEAQVKAMPEAALERVPQARILTLEGISDFLKGL